MEDEAMHLAYGRERIVGVIPEIGIVVKFPFIHATTAARQLIEYARNREWKRMRVLWRRSIDERNGFWNLLFGGIYANWREYRFYQDTHNQFVQPTYFSLWGFLNIQQYGKMCTVEDGDELVAFWNELRALTQDEVYADPHHFQNPENYCMHDTHVRMTDYGNKKVQEVLNHFGNKLAEKLHPPHQ